MGPAHLQRVWARSWGPSDPVRPACGLDGVLERPYGSKLLEAHPKAILFVDESHSLLQSGMHEPGDVLA